MSLREVRRPLPIPSTEPSRGRFILQRAVALAGWALFIYWWTVVLRSVSRAEIQFTVLFVGISLVVVCTVTVLWVMHNVGIFKRKGARKNLRVVKEDYSRDALERTVTFDGGVKEAQRAPFLRVRIDGNAKQYSARAESSAAAS